MHTTAPFLRAATAGMILLAAVAGCSETTAVNDSSRFSVYLKDAPGDVVQAVVTIDRVYLQGGTDAVDEDTTASSGVDQGAQDAARGRVLLTEDDVTVDLLTLVDDPMALLQNVVVPTGRYAGLRVVVSGGFVEVENADGTTSIYASSPDYAGLPDSAVVTGELRMPSFRSSGLKTQFPGALDVSDDAEAVLIDFDVSQSFGAVAGNSGAWVMHPSIKGERTAPPAVP
ncbi:MAG: DUF4382 domain-containing protein [Gemmatimonadaceae bacterium]